MVQIQSTECVCLCECVWSQSEKRKHLVGVKEEGNFSPSILWEQKLFIPSSAVKPGNGVLTVDETHVDDIICLSLGNAIKLTAACRATQRTTPHSHLPSAVYCVSPLNTNTFNYTLYVWTVHFNFESIQWQMSSEIVLCWTVTPKASEIACKNAAPRIYYWMFSELSAEPSHRTNYKPQLLLFSLFFAAVNCFYISALHCTVWQ